MENWNAQKANAKSKLFSQIILTGLVAGTLDIVAACTQFYVKTGNSPMRVLEYVASGALGPDAFTGGIGMALAGLFFHYFIAMNWTVLLFMLYPIFALLRKNKYATGVGYGIFVWAMMNLIVVPLSRIPARPLSLGPAIQAAIILIVCIGIPISLMANRFFSPKGSN